MARIRVLGPRPLLAATIRVLQDRGVVQVADASAIGSLHRELDAPTRRRRRDLGRALADVEHALGELGRLGAPVADSAEPPPPEGRSARLAARLAATTSALRVRAAVLADERDALRVYEPLFPELDALGETDRVAVFLLRIHGEGAEAALRSALGEAVELRPHVLASGDTVLLLIVPRARAAEIDEQLARAGVEPAPLPPSFAGGPLADALPRLRQRLAAVERELAVIHAEAAGIARDHGDDLARARRGYHDALLVLAAAEHAATSARVFALEGWLPAHDRDAVTRALAADAGPELTVEDIARDQWVGSDAPVVLANPAIFAPFELLTSLLPLPRYGAIDPTPYVAVFFPMMFGVIVGDVGYGVAIAALALGLRFAGPRARSVSRIAAAVAFYTIAFGVLYGELFGDLGARWFGMHALWFDRRQAVLGALVLAIALGLVHIVLGLVIAAANRWRRDRRVAIGRGLTAIMLGLVACALLVLFHRAPAVLLRPTVIALLVALPIVVVLEGATAVLDLVSILGHVLSYARVMALGTASVMLAVVANRMYGAFGSAAIGVAFALVFHLVNFALALFSPTIQVLRLHYVEFFDTFFEPGGGPYQPLRHWSPGAAE